MTDRPINAKAWEVQALLAGTKTQWRAILKPQPDPRSTACHLSSGKWMSIGPASTGGTAQWDPWRPSPFAVGDRLWVREAFQIPALCPIQYRATDTQRIGHWDPALGPWSPSIHMPRWASRLTLTVTDVRIQRLQDISEEDAQAEGVEWEERCCGSPAAEWGPGDYGSACCGQPRTVPPVEAFADLWNSWSANPWVVARSFTVHLANIDRLGPAARNGRGHGEAGIVNDTNSTEGSSHV